MMRILRSQNHARAFSASDVQCDCRDAARNEDCKVLPKEAVAEQLKLMVCKVEMKTKGRQRQERFKRTRWWKLNEEKHREKFVKAMKEELVQEEWSWEETSMKMRIVAIEVLGVTSGRAGKKEKKWWWNTKVQEAVAEKKKKSERDMNRREETIRNYKQANKKAKKAVAKMKCKAHDDLFIPVWRIKMGS